MRPAQVLALLLIVGLGACGGPGTYPVSGEPCGPDDPVRDLSVAECTAGV